MAFAPSSVIVTGAAVDTRARDQLSFPFLARPQAMTVYCRFIFLTDADAATRRIFQLGAGNGASPRFLVYVSAVPQLRIGYGTSDITCANTLSIGDAVEMRAFLTANGSPQLGVVRNGGLEILSVAGSAEALPQAWSGSLLWMNSIGAAAVGFNAFRNLCVVAGIHTMQEMRIWAGTD